MNARELLAVRVRELRRERGLTQRELAQAAGLSRSVVARIEQGNAKPHPDSLAAIAYTLGLSVSDLAGEETGLERDILAEFGCRLRNLREAEGLTRQELGQAVGVTAATIATYECGRVCPQKKFLAALAERFGVSVSELLPQAVTLTVYEDERALIARYRSLGAEARAALLAAAEDPGKADASQ